jgi:hypothetical protein
MPVKDLDKPLFRAIFVCRTLKRNAFENGVLPLDKFGVNRPFSNKGTPDEGRVSLDGTPTAGKGRRHAMKARLMDGKFSEGFRTLDMLSRVGSFDEDLAAAIRRGKGAETAVKAMRDVLLGGTNHKLLRFFSAKLTLADREKLIAHPKVLDCMFAMMRSHKQFQLIGGYFNKPADQIARVRKWNLERGWGISDEVFAEAKKSIPKWPEEELVAVVLVPYLADKTNEDETVTSGLERTFHELWACAKAEQEANVRWDGYDKAGPERLRLHNGIEHPATSSGVLRWEVINMGSQRNKKPGDVRSAKSSPLAGILAAAALHPEWVKSMDGDKVPYAWVPGYEASTLGFDPWTSVPSLCFDRDYREIGLGYGWSGFCSPEWAVPSFFRESGEAGSGSAG